MFCCVGTQWMAAREGLTGLVRGQSAWDDWRDSFLARLAHSTSVIVLLDADHTNGTDELAALLKVRAPSAEFISMLCCTHSPRA